MLTAMILAGGMETRLQTVLADRQKVAAEVAGTPFIVWLLCQIEKTCTRKEILFPADSAGCVGPLFLLDLDFSIEKFGD